MDTTSSQGRLIFNIFASLAEFERDLIRISKATLYNYLRHRGVEIGSYRTIWNLPLDVDPAVVYERGAVAVGEDEPVDSLLDRKLALGADAIKIIIEDWGGMVPRLSNARISELVRASHARGLQVFAHVSMPEHVADGVANGVDGVMHSAEAPISDETLGEMAQNRIFYVSTLEPVDCYHSSHRR